MERHSFVPAFGRNIGVAFVVSVVLYLASVAAGYRPVLVPEHLGPALAGAFFVGTLGASAANGFRAKSPLRPGWHFGAAGALAVLGFVSVASLVRTVAFATHPVATRLALTGALALALFATSAWLSGLVVDPVTERTVS